ncbi:MAG: VanW family protein, partial [Patescibacteria group bacterium]
MAKKRKIDRKKVIRMAIQFLVAVLLIPFFFFSFYFGKIYPGVAIAGLDVSGKTPEEAIKLLSENITVPQEIVLSTNKIPTSSFSLSYDYNKTADAAYRIGRSGNPIFDTYEIITTLTSKTNVGIRTGINEESLYKSLTTIAGEVGTDAVFPSATIVKGKVVVDPGKKGQEVDLNQLRILIGQNLTFNKNSEIVIPMTTIDPTLNSFEEATFTKRAETLSTKSIRLTFEDREIVIKGNELLSLLSKSPDEIIEKVAIQINRPISEPKLVFQDGRVKEFNPARNGVSVKKDGLSELILKSLDTLEKSEDKITTVQIPVLETTPKVKTEDVNNLGIKELIGRGRSTFRGSIPSRVFNVNLAATRISGTLIAPGETFSFVNAVGDISKLSGYQQAYIIQGGKTILGDGGGVCQVSTTLFRAALNAGLPIVERHAHAYRVYYYEQ